MDTAFRIILAGTLFFLSSPLLPQPFPKGGEFQVSTYTSGNQDNPSVAMTPSGAFIVVWDTPGIRARRYDATGNPLGDDFPVSAFGEMPSLAVGLEDEFTVVWEELDGSSSGIQARRYDSTGNPLSDPFLVNTDTGGLQRNPSVAVGPSGDLVVVWDSIPTLDGDPVGSIRLRRYDSTGNPMGEELRVNTFTTDVQWAPSVSADSMGNFVVVWASYGSAFDDVRNSIQVRRIDSAGNLLGEDFQVNTYTLADEFYPSVSMGPSGAFVVVWERTLSLGVPKSIHARRFDSVGNPLGEEFQVNTTPPTWVNLPSVSVGPSNEFIVVWDSWAGSGTGFSVQARCYDSAGGPSCNDFQVNTYTPGSRRPSVSAAPTGEFVVVWSSTVSAEDSYDYYSIQGKRFFALGAVFADGFESGNTSGWSGAMP